MILDAATRYGIILAQSWLIGNRASDIDAGNAAGVGRSILLEDASNAEVVTGSVDRVESLEAARLLLAELVSP